MISGTGRFAMLAAFGLAVTSTPFSFFEKEEGATIGCTKAFASDDRDDERLPCCSDLQRRGEG